ncbi:MAG: 12-oxophytodienoate reductase, partial [Pseudomonadota bacterium]
PDQTLPLPDAGASRQAKQDRRLEGEEFDLVAVGRAMIANPDWATLVRGGETAALEPFRKEMLAELV